MKRYNSQKGYAFIPPDDGGKDVFVHVSALERAGLRDLVEGQKVSFQIQTDRRKARFCGNFQPANNVFSFSFFERGEPHSFFHCVGDATLAVLAGWGVVSGGRDVVFSGAVAPLDEVIRRVTFVFKRGEAERQARLCLVLFLCEHDSDLNSIHYKVFFRIKALEVLGGAFVRGIEHIPGIAVFPLDRANFAL